MQEAQNKLKEIIWEITDNCNQNCSYCGSKDILNQTPIDSEKIFRIIDNIASYPPAEINISGGNPLLVSFAAHEYLVRQLSAAGCVCKIIVNPFNVPTAPSQHTVNVDNESKSKFSRLKLYDWIGFSVNTKSELRRLYGLLKYNKDLRSRSTIITNFNTGNVFNFSDIENLAISYDLPWQVQYTMYAGPVPAEQAIYENDGAKQYLKDMIDRSNARIVRSDNMNDGLCSAGRNSLGILADGTVIPCLSMRAWTDPITSKYVMGNVLHLSLEEIWTMGFARFRCNSFKCCKDITKCQEQPITEPLKSEVDPVSIIARPIHTDGPIPPYEPPKPLKPYERGNPNITVMYGVNTGQVFVYGVFTDWSTSAVLPNLPKKEEGDGNVGE